MERFNVAFYRKSFNNDQWILIADHARKGKQSTREMNQIGPARPSQAIPIHCFNAIQSFSILMNMPNVWLWMSNSVGWLDKSHKIQIKWTHLFKLKTHCQTHFSNIEHISNSSKRAISIATLTHVRVCSGLWRARSTDFHQLIYSIWFLIFRTAKQKDNNRNRSHSKFDSIRNAFSGKKLFKLSWMLVCWCFTKCVN